jgi:hypothetical protein
MSRRKKRYAKPGDSPNIEWLKHRTGYPSPDEREKIIQMRRDISMELLMMMLSGIAPESHKAQALRKKYGEAEITRALEKLEEGMQFPSIIADKARSYREYRQRYARFGAGLRFLSSKELEDVYKENAESLITEEANEAARLLLIGWRDWEDITPPAIPAPPADYPAPAPTSYPAPISEFLKWGDDLNRSDQFENEAEWLQWKKHIPALTRMALDPGLLNGWPADPASWAPWHAIHALGNMQAWDSAPAIASLADLENDWLSDHLPHIWADMGREVEPILWMLLETKTASAKQRGLAAEGLQILSKDTEAMEDRVISGLEKMLKNETSFDPTLNAYLLHTLAKMGALGEVEDTAISAIENGRVDEDIFDKEDLNANLEDDDFDDDDFDEEDEDDIIDGRFDEDEN